MASRHLAIDGNSPRIMYSVFDSEELESESPPPHAVVNIARHAVKPARLAFILAPRKDRSSEWRLQARSRKVPSLCALPHQRIPRIGSHCEPHRLATARWWYLGAP